MAGRMRIRSSNDGPFWSKIRECERTILEEALITSHGNITNTARNLGITLKTVHNKIKDHNFLPAWIDHLRHQNKKYYE